MCGNCHPFYTGTQNIIDTAGQVERFQKRLERQVRGLTIAGSPPVQTGPPRCRCHVQLRRPGAHRGRPDARPRRDRRRLPPSRRATSSGQSESLDKGPHGWRLAKAPFLRGLIVLYETLVVGTRWLIRSANIQASAEGVELGKGSVALMLGLTLTIGVGVFFLLPLFVATFTTGGVQQDWVQHTVEGLVRVGIFLGYLALISRMPDIRRVFEYHGAEHMTIHALEAGDPLTTDAVRKYPTAHPRCGTEFLVVVIILSIFAFSLVGRQSDRDGWSLSRLLLDPGDRGDRLRDPAVRRAATAATRS